MNYMLATVFGFIVGASFFAWWIREDMKNLRQKALQLDALRERYRQKMYEALVNDKRDAGVEIDPDGV